jgi:dihydrofolate reductase
LTQVVYEAGLLSSTLIDDTIATAKRYAAEENTIGVLGRGCAQAKMEVDVRKLIAGMKLSVDGKIEGPEHGADWVEAWSEEYGLTPQIDACLLGGGMYPGYEQYWTGIQNEPDKPAWITGSAPTPAELEWARFIEQTPHYVLSSTLTSALWPNTTFVRGLEEITALKQQPGKDIYLVGGARTTASLIDAGVVDELRLSVYPLIAGEGKALFATTERRRGLELRKVQQLQDGRVSLIYGID